MVRATYLSDCAQLTGINEMTLITQMNKMIRAGKEGGSSQNSTSSQTGISSPTNDSSLTISPIDRMIGELVVKYGERIILRNVDNGEGGTMNVSVAQFIKLNLDADDLRLESDNIWKAEHAEEKDWKAESYFLQHKDIEISRLAQQLSTDKVQLSERLQMNYSDEELYEKTQHVLLDFRMKYVTDHLRNLEIQIKQNANNPAKTQELMQEYMEMKQIQKELAKAIGIKVV